ncbi:hypothetical protein IWX50DRAFT_468803 [Phyllosticta citricarpa]
MGPESFVLSATLHDFDLILFVIARNVRCADPDSLVVHFRVFLWTIFSTKLTLLFFLGSLFGSLPVPLLQRVSLRIVLNTQLAKPTFAFALSLVFSFALLFALSRIRNSSAASLL